MGRVFPFCQVWGFYYFQAACNRYVGQNAEELHREAISAGSHVSQALAAILDRRGPKPPSLPELVAQRAAVVADAKDQSLRAKIARARTRQAASKADVGQMLLNKRLLGLRLSHPVWQYPSLK